MTATARPGTLYGIGIGPGDPELLTLKAVRTIEACAVVCYPEARGSSGKVLAKDIATAALPGLAAKRSLGLHLPMTRDAAVLAANRDAAAAAICECLAAGDDVCFLTLGDPSIYSTYIYLHRLVAARGYSAAIVPGVTSFAAAAAELGDGLVDAEQPLHIVPGAYQEQGLELDGEGTSVLMKSGAAILGMLEQLKDLERRGGAVRIVENCSLPDQRIWRLDEITPEHKPGYFTIVVAKPAPCRPADAAGAWASPIQTD